MTQYFLQCGECRALVVDASDNEAVHTKFHRKMLGYGISIHYDVVLVPSDDAAFGAR